MGTTWLRGATQAVQSDCCECMAVSRTSFRRLTVIVEALAPKASVTSASTATQPRPAAAEIASTGPVATDANVLVPVGLCFPPLLPDALEVAEQLCELLAPVPDVDSLVFALVVNVVEVAQHLDHGEVAARVVNHTFRAVFDEVFEQLKGLTQSADRAIYRYQRWCQAAARSRRRVAPCRSASTDWLPSP